MPAKAKTKASAKPTKKLATQPKRTPQKESALGSIKKMLGVGATGKKGAPAQAKKPVKDAPVAAKGKLAAAVKGAKPSKGAAAAKPTGKGGKNSSGSKTIQTSITLASRTVVTAQVVVAGSPVCREVACELMATTGGYCRMHYIKNWKKIKRKEMILKEKKLNHYIEELVSKYPDKYIEAIRQDLASEKDFAKVIADLEIEEGLDDFESVETESAEGIIDNLKRDFEDEGDAF